MPQESALEQLRQIAASERGTRKILSYGSKRHVLTALMARAYTEEQASIPTICKAAGRTRGFVSHALASEGVTLRTTAEPRAQQ